MRVQQDNFNAQMQYNREVNNATRKDNMQLRMMDSADRRADREADDRRADRKERMAMILQLIGGLQNLGMASVR